MADDQTQDMRIKQLEDSLLRQEAEMRELRSEVEALGEVLVVLVATLERQSPISYLEYLDTAAKERGNDRTARALEALVSSAQAET